MAGTIGRVGFRIDPQLRSITCLQCGTTRPGGLDDLPRCDACGQSYCPTCLERGEVSLRCAEGRPECALGIPFREDADPLE